MLRFLIFLMMLSTSVQARHYAPVVDLNHSHAPKHKVAHSTKQVVKVVHNTKRATVKNVAAHTPAHSRSLSASHSQPHITHVASAYRDGLDKPVASVLHSGMSTRKELSWMMPANGPILMMFNSEHKGISIGGQVGDPVYAASGGKVVYASNRIKGYGNLVIIKHDNQYLSAYAYNSALKVKMGDYVKKGQVIAAMGHSATKKALLYFEIRKDGKSINPISIQGII